MRADRRWRTRKEKKEWARRLQSNDPGLDVVHPQAAGIDVGNASHYVAVRPDRDPEPVRQFKCFTADLHRLADWLKSCGVQTVAMQSTGVYWIPLYDILEERGFEVYLVNARHTKNLPGRKSEVVEPFDDAFVVELLRVPERQRVAERKVGRFDRRFGFFGTGRRRAEPMPGVQTLRTRQSSETGGSWGPPWASSAAVLPPLCGARGPSASASRIPAQGAGLAGARNRLAPPVGAP